MEYKLTLDSESDINQAAISKAFYETAIEEGWQDFTATITQVYFLDEAVEVHLDVEPRYLCTNLYFGNPSTEGGICES